MQSKVEYLVAHGADLSLIASKRSVADGSWLTPIELAQATQFEPMAIFESAPEYTPAPTPSTSCASAPSNVPANKTDTDEERDIDRRIPHTATAGPNQTTRRENHAVEWMNSYRDVGQPRQLEGGSSRAEVELVSSQPMGKAAFKHDTSQTSGGKSRMVFNSGQSLEGYKLEMEQAKKLSLLTSGSHISQDEMIQQGLAFMLDQGIQLDRPPRTVPMDGNCLFSSLALARNPQLTGLPLHEAATDLRICSVTSAIDQIQTLNEERLQKLQTVAATVEEEPKNKRRVDADVSWVL